VYEKLVSRTDAYPWTDDEGIWAFDLHSQGEARANTNLRAGLTWFSIYWFSRDGPAAFVRIFYEMVKVGGVTQFPKTSVPVGISFLEVLTAQGIFVVCRVPKRESFLSRNMTLEITSPRTRSQKYS